MLLLKPEGMRSSMIHGRLIPYREVYSTLSVTYRSPQKPISLGVCSLSCKMTINRNSSSCRSAHADFASGKETLPSLFPSAKDRMRLTSSERFPCSPSFAWKQQMKKIKYDFINYSQSICHSASVTLLWIIGITSYVVDFIGYGCNRTCHQLPAELPFCSVFIGTEHTVFWENYLSSHFKMQISKFNHCSWSDQSLEKLYQVAFSIFSKKKYEEFKSLDQV